VRFTGNANSRLPRPGGRENGKTPAFLLKAAENRRLALEVARRLA
jgi:hypothetical protein